MSKPSRSNRKAKGEGHLRRAEILRAAETIFVRDGYDGATIRKIADEVGVSSTALYMHFRDKDQILIEICKEGIAALHALNIEIAGRPIDAVSRMRLMLLAYIEFGLGNGNVYRLLFNFRASQSAADPAKQTQTELGANAYGAFKQVLDEIARGGRLRHAEADVAAQILLSGCHGFVALGLDRAFFGAPQVDAMKEAMIDGLFEGVVKA